MNRRKPREYAISEIILHKKGSQYYEYNNFSNRIPLPENIKSRVNSLVRYAVDSGMLRYIAYASAVKYVLEHEYPEYLLLMTDSPEPPLRGYSKCLRIWSELGLIHNTSKREALMRVVNSREFEDKLISEGIPSNLLNMVRQRVIEYMDDVGIPEGSLKKIIKSLINTALELGGAIRV